MSATGRKKRIKKSNKITETKREEFDFYPTPQWAILRFLEKAHNRLPSGYWVEPAAGNGALVKTVQSFGQGYENNHWHLVEIQEKFEGELKNISSSVHIGNFMKHSLPQSALNPKTKKADVVITNPPYKEAEPMIKHARQLSNAVVMLLRINFLSSEKRHSWLSGNAPDVYVLPNRPSFRGKGTDATDYAWFLWDDKSNGKIFFLDKTSRESRAAEKRKLLDK